MKTLGCRPDSIGGVLHVPALQHVAGATASVGNDAGGEGPAEEDYIADAGGHELSISLHTLHPSDLTCVQYTLNDSIYTHTTT